MNIEFVLPYTSGWSSIFQPFFLFKAVDSRGTCVRITIIICYYYFCCHGRCSLMDVVCSEWSLTVAEKPNLSEFFVLFQWQSKFLIQFSLKHGHWA